MPWERNEVGEKSRVSLAGKELCNVLSCRSACYLPSFDLDALTTCRTDELISVYLDGSKAIGDE